MHRILVTNDDGYFSPGIQALARALRQFADVTVVAPDKEASAVGHALTLRRPLRLEVAGEHVFAVDGTPTDCVNLGVVEVLDEPPDLIVSGINKGLNIGDDVTYSGTVAGALEGALLGFQAMAVSLDYRGDDSQFGHVAEAAATLAEAILKNPLPPRTFLNVNFPAGPPRGVRVTVQGARNHVTKVDRRVDPRGRAYFWIEEAEYAWHPLDRSDYQAIRDGFISITPLQPDLTDAQSMSAAEALSRALDQSR